MSISKALEEANSGDTLLIADGTYNESIIITKSIKLLGNCVQKSIINDPGPHAGHDAGVIFIVDDVEVEIKNIQITGEQNGIYIKSENANVTVDGVWIHKAKRDGILMLEGKLNLYNTLIDSTQANDEGIRGRGLGIGFGYYDVTVKNSTFELNREINVNITRGNNRTGPVGKVLLEDVIIRGNLSTVKDIKEGSGLIINDGPDVTIKRALIDNNRNVGIMIKKANTKVLFEDVIIKNTQHQESDLFHGYGINLREGASLEMKQVLLDNNIKFGIVVADEGTNLIAEDLIVMNTQSASVDNDFGYGIYSEAGVNISLERVIIEKNRTGGIVLHGKAITADIKDAIVRKTLHRELEPQFFGLGLSLDSEANLKMERSLFNMNADLGIQLNGENTKAEITDLILENTQSNKVYLAGGKGISVQRGASLTLKQAKINNNREIGLFVIENAKANLENVQISNTQINECALPDTEAPVPCEEFIAGFGIVCVDDSEIEFKNLDIDNNAFVGTQLARSGIIKGDGILVNKNQIGFNIQDLPEDFDFNTQVTRLFMNGNLVNFDSQELKVPELLE